MSFPHIVTAIPMRRYQYGEFVLTVLGDVQSGDGEQYRYIMAVARDPDPAPGMFVCLQRNGDPDAEGAWALRLAMADGSQVIGTDDGWGDLDAFVKETLDIVGRMLQLDHEAPQRLS